MEQQAPKIYSKSDTKNMFLRQGGVDLKTQGPETFYYFSLESSGPGEQVTRQADRGANAYETSELIQMEGKTPFSQK